MKMLPWLLIACFVLLPMPDRLAAANRCQPVVRDAWIRLTPAGMPMHGGFLRIDNPCAQSFTIVGASSPLYGRMELHETRLVDGISRMRPLATVAVPAHGRVEFKPGGLHWMLMQPQAGLRAGEQIPVTLRLADGGRIATTFELRAAGR